MPDNGKPQFCQIYVNLRPRCVLRGLCLNIHLLKQLPNGLSKILSPLIASGLAQDSLIFPGKSWGTPYQLSIIMEVHLPAPLGCCLSSILLKEYLWTLWSLLTSMNGCLRSWAPSNGYLRPCTVIYVHAFNPKTTFNKNLFHVFEGLLDTCKINKRTFQAINISTIQETEQERGET